MAISLNIYYKIFRPHHKIVYGNDGNYEPAEHRTQAPLKRFSSEMTNFLEAMYDTH
jgi:hypothetical protein